jgi:serralysin
MYGFGGNDQYVVDNAGDRVFEAAGGGSDRVLTAINYGLAAGQQIELYTTSNTAGTGAINLTGNEFAQTIQGNAGANVINGGGGADIMQGFGGNDQYFVDNAGDKVFEAVGGGSDRVFTSINYALAAGAQIELYTTSNTAGTGAINLLGNEFSQTIQGNAGANTLNGGGGADLMYGFGGNDQYWVDNVGDKIVETAGNGTDRVLTSISYALAAGANIELYTTTNTAGTTAINLVGNALNQTIQGNAGANTINGAGGADIMQGFGGNDQYFVDNAGDKVFEAAGGGSDRVLTAINYALAAGQQIELYTTTNTAGTGAISLTGNEFAQTIQGNAGGNAINGGGGSDTLYGFGGHDAFIFSTALGASNIDTVADFSVADDIIYLAHAIFTGLGANHVLDASAFHVGAAATTSAQHIIYNSSTGNLYFDDDGSGAHAAQQFAHLSTGLALTNADFFVA